jgi:transposase
MFIGIDVSKDELFCATFPEVVRWRNSNDDAGIQELIDRLKSLQLDLIVLEATGGYQIGATAAMLAEGFPVVVVNPRQARLYAQAKGILAKTDRIDADVLAMFAEAIRPQIRSVPDEATQELQALQVRRRQVMTMLVAERNRKVIARKRVRQQIDKHIQWLEQSLADIDKDIQTTVRSSPIWKDKADLLKSVPGIGSGSSALLLSALPELGQLSNKRISALVGLAPFNHDSGHYRGKRAIRGGRIQLRAALYMPTLTAIRCNPKIRDFYQRLVQAGKAPKVAITACMRKMLIMLNAIVRSGTPWRADYGI